MQYKVPQNIDMEDKIIGPLTLIQFLYLLAGGVIIYMMAISIGTTFLFWILAIPIGVFVLALAFLKIQDQPLMHFVKAGLAYMGRPKVRVWHRHGFAMSAVQENYRKTKKIKKAPPKKGIDKSELEKLAMMLDTRRVNNIDQEIQEAK